MERSGVARTNLCSNTMTNTNERAEFLGGLANLDTTRTGGGISGRVWIRVGDLAELLGISPMDVLDKTELLTVEYDHPDEYWKKDDARDCDFVRDWLRRLRDDETANVEILLERHRLEESLCEAFEIEEARS